jgi:hypothetical protein
LIAILAANTTHAADDASVETSGSIPDSPISYSIEATLNPETREIDGHETINWLNTLGTPVTSIPMHLYLNAFSNEGSSWYRYTLGPRFQLDTLLKRFDDPWGWTEPRSIRQGDAELEWQAIAPDDGNHLDRSLIEVQLAEAVAPGETLVIDVDWTTRMPAAAARTGGHDRFFFIAQWFPKIAGVRPEGTFNRHQFFGATEFYANFADFDVTIAAPKDWAIASTGKGERLRVDGDIDWHRYQQKGVIDFAFTVGADMEDFVTPHELATGGTVDIHVFQPKGSAHQVPRWTKAVAASLDTMSQRVMPYPYETITVVLPPRSGLRTLGMEYPTFFTGATGGDVWDNSIAKDLRLNESVIAHEFAHQYFNALVATNEFEDAFMDEGMTEYWGQEIMTDTWGEESGNGYLFGRPLNVYSSNMRTQPITTNQPAVWSGPSFLVRDYSGGAQFYDRPATTFQTAAKLFGQDVVDAIFARYTQLWSFKHPRIEDFWTVAEEVAGSNVAEMLREAYLHPAFPDYRVTSVSSSRYEPPRGYIHENGERTYVDSDWEGDELLGLDPVAYESDEHVLVEILDPGHTRATRTMGQIERRPIQPGLETTNESALEEDEPEYYVSEARIAGPDWDHLPVTVELHFSDGAVVVDDWDGKGVYRVYRVVRAAQLDAVIIDPDYKIRLDVVPVNNGLRRDPEGDIPRNWSRWLTAVYQLIAEGASSWL